MKFTTNFLHKNGKFLILDFLQNDLERITAQVKDSVSGPVESSLSQATRNATMKKV